MKFASLPLLLLCTLSLCLVSTCRMPVGTPVEEPITEPANPHEAFFYGYWVRMDGSNEQWYIASDGVRIGSAAKTAISNCSATELAVSNNWIVNKVSDNVVKVAPPSNAQSVFYLFRRAGANSSAKLGVYTNANARLSSKIPSNLGGIQVIIKNRNNPVNKFNLLTNQEGITELDSVIIGDEYEVTIPVQSTIQTAISTTMTPSFDGEHLGFVSVTNTAQNFKMQYQIEGRPRYLYAGELYTINIQFTNIGTSDMLSGDYEISLPEEVLLENRLLQGILGSVQAHGGVASKSFELRIVNQTDSVKTYNIPISVISVDGTSQWYDTINLQVFLRPMNIFIRSDEHEVQGVIISPTRESLPFRTESYESIITVPELEHPYILALSGANYNSETKYAIRIGSRPETNGYEHQLARINEPNNTENETTPLLKEKTITGFLGTYDLDFYTLHPID
jgi:hypothetical protein